MKSLLSSLFILFSILATAQVPEPHMVWMKSIGGSAIDQIARHITETSDGGFVITVGTVSPPGTGSIDSFCAPVARRVTFVKYNHDATNAEWSKCYGTAGDSTLGILFPNTDGSFTLGGSFNSSVGRGFIIAEHDALGNVLWQRNHSKGMDAALNSMIRTKDGGYLMLGDAHYIDTNVVVHYGSWETFDYWVLKVDSAGNKMWSKVIGGSDDEDAGVLVPAPGNGFYIAGTTGSNDYNATGNHGGADIYVVRCDDTGGILWHRCLGGSGHDLGTAACRNGKGGIIVTGYTRSSDGNVHHHIGNDDFWVLELDSTGNVLWENCYGTATDYEKPRAICKSQDGSIWVVGTASRIPDDVYLLHIDSVGTLLQTRILHSNQQNCGQMLHPLSDGTVLAGGYFGDKSGDFSALPYYGAYDIFLAAFAPWPASVDDVIKQRQYKIYPNPTDGILHIEAMQLETSSLITITDIGGRSMLQATLASGKKTIDLKTDELEPGFYIVTITLDGSTYTKSLSIK